MKAPVSLDLIYKLSEGVVSREIEGETVIVPLTNDIGDMEDALFTLNKTAQSIWHRLDGQHTLSQVVEDLSNEFASDSEEIERDVLGLLNELVERKMVVEVPAT